MRNVQLDVGLEVSADLGASRARGVIIVAARTSAEIKINTIGAEKGK